MICARLTPYIPAKPSSKDNIEVFASLLRSGNEITAEFTLRGDTATVRWPPQQPHVTLGGELWKHTCFELFVAKSDAPAYWEYNFSPSRAWAMYAFKDYRQPTATDIKSAPDIFTPAMSASTFTMQVKFNLEAPLQNKSLSIGVCAVIENQNGACQYFALAHCGPRPDFHLREGFLIKLNR